MSIALPKIAVVFLGALAVACSAPKVGVDTDPEFDFSSAHTYSWIEGMPVESGLQQRRVVDGVDAALASRGYERKDEGPTDLWVFTEAGGRREVRSTGNTATVGVSHYNGPGGVGFSSGTGNRIYEVTVGTLVISIVDAKKDVMVFRAEAEKTLDNDPDAVAKAIQKAIDKAFKDFPVSSGASGAGE